MGVPKRQTVYGIELMNCSNNVISKISSGFQHSLLVTSNINAYVADNNLFGAGRYDKYQLGIDIISEHSVQSRQGGIINKS